MKINSSCSTYYKNMCLLERLRSRRYQTQKLKNDNDQGEDDLWILMDISTSTRWEAMRTSYWEEDDDGDDD